jgi:methylated-DNA-[protein]-cysteine S-methyltransferase
MIQQSAFYNSPVGMLKISCEGNYLTELVLAEKSAETREPICDYLNFVTEQLEQYFKKERESFEINIKFIKGTDFQKTVWNALLEIPYGQTVSYAKIAAGIGNPKAVRAAGSAIGANPVSIIIPCHRVIGSDGSLTGFAWGLELKKKLLDLEKEKLYGIQKKLY